MKPRLVAGFLLVSTSLLSAADQWRTGKVVDESRARYLAGVYNTGGSTTSSSGTVSATGRSTTTGQVTTTDVDGTYTGSSSTRYSGTAVPLYKVYEGLIVEGDDMVYVTQERLRWRWSKPAHVTVNGNVRYYVDGRKLHVLDDDEKEHVVEIIKQIKKEASPPSQPR